MSEINYDVLGTEINYNVLNTEQRRTVRQAYVKSQGGKCHHCKGALAFTPPPEINSLKIDWDLFPPNFLRHPVHLHHNHATGLTIGAVHSYCNAVLWQYHGE